tara:strand:+ start:768 stop:992 length:225 start_codon:yes stop_codon:yes gene_type:complete
MCAQTVGLVQKACEENNFSCSTISIIDEIMDKIKIKRYLSVPYELGFPLGNPQKYNEQKKNIKYLIEKVSLKHI